MLIIMQLQDWKHAWSLKDGSPNRDHFVSFSNNTFMKILFPTFKN